MYDIRTLEKLNALKEDNRKALAALATPKSVFGSKGQPKFEPSKK